MPGPTRKRFDLPKPRVTLAQAIDAACVLAAVVELAPMAETEALVELAVRAEEHCGLVLQLGETRTLDILDVEADIFWEVGL